MTKVMKFGKYKKEPSAVTEQPSEEVVPKSVSESVPKPDTKSVPKPERTPRPKPEVTKKDLEVLTQEVQDLKQGLGGFLITIEQRQWLSLYDQLPEDVRWQSISLMLLEHGFFAKYQEKGRSRFKTVDFEDLQAILGKDRFMWAWRKYRELGLLVPDKSTKAGRDMFLPLEEYISQHEEEGGGTA